MLEISNLLSISMCKTGYQLLDEDIAAICDLCNYVNDTYILFFILCSIVFSWIKIILILLLLHYTNIIIIHENTIEHRMKNRI